MTERSRVVLRWGDDAFLLRDAALELLGDLRATEVDAADWQGGELQDLATPSLFGEPRALLVSDVRSLPKDAMAELATYLAAPDPDAPLVLCCTTAERGKPPAALLKLVEPIGTVSQVAVARKDLEGWVLQRAHRHALDLSPPAARALVDTIGVETARLAAAVQQLASAFAGQRVGPAQVHQQFRGLGEQKTWDLCDKAFGRDLPGAIRSLRAIEESGDEALMVLGGIASRVRDLIRVRSLPERLPAGEVAKRAGLRFDWQARRYLQQARHYTVEDLVRLHERITEVDRALKSGGTADVIMPTLITEIAAG
ncbi:MAG TPA: DNA polymerase III subunit delta [Actinomycetota bacterium]|nr:DNA polymerase III subunit delta [Actinomycetota bacterium]